MFTETKTFTCRYRLILWKRRKGQIVLGRGRGEGCCFIWEPFFLWGESVWDISLGKGWQKRELSNFKSLGVGISVSVTVTVVMTMEMMVTSTDLFLLVPFINI